MSLAHELPSAAGPGEPRHDWIRGEIRALFDFPFAAVVFRAAQVVAFVS